MECNKEEAIRAKGIAVDKMQSKDFPGARKIVLKAQQLYSELENITQMLMVCDVHICADKKLFGNEMDWYGILQVEQTVDEATIKKQYRKFALLLHPDKNNFPGAEAAFKLIGDAQRVLLDPGKRSLHDMKRKSSNSMVRPGPAFRPPQRPPYGPNVGVQNNYRNNFTGFNPHQQQRPPTVGQQGFSNPRQTFWTACPFCSVKYQYYVEVMNKSILCRNCTKPFISYESVVRGTPMASNLNQSAFPHMREVPIHGFSKVDLGGPGKSGGPAKSSAEHSKAEFSQKKGFSNGLDSQKVDRKRRRKKDAESSESDSCDTDSSNETEEDAAVDEDGEFKAGVNLGSHGERPRRSDRRKRNVSYKENHSDEEDFESYSKKAKMNGSSGATEVENRNRMKEDRSAEKTEQVGSSPTKFKEPKNVKGNEKAEGNGCEKSSVAPVDSASESGSKSTVDTEFYDYPDPDFHDFDNDRREGCFSVGQIWAAYDTCDAMPRFYARIRKVFSPQFKLRITWLESHPDNEDEINWVNAGLPASCGKFTTGESDYTEDRLMFSHMVYWEKGSQRDTFKVLPRKGEVWAVFKNWDLKWKNESKPDRKFDYEFVEVLSEWADDVDTPVAYLGKVKGFVSVFCRIRKKGNDTHQISPGERFRFSHMIPSFKLKGDEREGVPKGSFELDPAALPKSIEEVDVPDDIVDGVRNSQPNGSCSRSSPDKAEPEMWSKTNASEPAKVQDANLEPEVVNVKEDSGVPLASTPEAMEIPDPEFFHFDAEKSVEKFQAGQIWSLYHDDDGLPKYYGQITKVASNQGFKVRLKWLTACGLPNNVIQWNDKAMPICCGKFRVGKLAPQSYTSGQSFSHQLSAEPTGKKNEYSILPRKGQVWALYRNWSSEIKLSDLLNCCYEIVEVLEENNYSIKVSLLEKIDGFNAVFKSQRKEGSIFTMDVLCTELLRFSHQIPAFRLTNERGGTLRGFWELDPGALPVHYFSRK